MSSPGGHQGQPPQPGYFTQVARLNRDPHRLLPDEQLPGLSLDEVLAYQACGAVVLDVRSPEAFARGHLRRSLNVGLGGRFAEHAGTILDADEDIVIMCDPGCGREARVRLSRVGLDAVIGAIESRPERLPNVRPGGHSQPADQPPAR